MNWLGICDSSFCGYFFNGIVKLREGSRITLRLEIESSEDRIVKVTEKAVEKRL